MKVLAITITITFLAASASADPTAELALCVSKGVATHYVAGSDVDVAAELVTNDCLDEGLDVAKSQTKNAFAKRALAGEAGEIAAKRIVHPLAVSAIRAVAE